MDTLALDGQLNALIIQNRTVDAFTQFYAENVVAQENDEPERLGGRETWMQARLGFEKSVKKYNAQVLAHAANGATSFSEWRFELELEGMGPLTVVQVAVRQWQDGRVVHERFYHK